MCKRTYFIKITHTIYSYITNLLVIMIEMSIAKNYLPVFDVFKMVDFDK